MMSKNNRFAKTTRIKRMLWAVKDSHSTNSTESLAAIEPHDQLQSLRIEHRADRAAQTHVPRSTFTDTAPLVSNQKGNAENLCSLVGNASDQGYHREKKAEVQRMVAN